MKVTLLPVKWSILYEQIHTHTHTCIWWRSGKILATRSEGNGFESSTSHYAMILSELFTPTSSSHKCNTCVHTYLRKHTPTHRHGEELIFYMLFHCFCFIGSVLLSEGDCVTFGHPMGETLESETWVRQPDSEYQFVVSLLYISLCNIFCYHLFDFSPYLLLSSTYFIHSQSSGNQNFEILCYAYAPFF